ncbi:basic helix-loop-helix neural transcription factor TAP isoform X2 [Anopheles maculipalpis]|uniref:basic helix-loop-helix neural transcription factor TAP isoform X2 n=1 Tax=Anopheles maculipalpis TaxID=1496333 RepID=UPI002159A2D2|nr:basic helix-loop-helix neural transcription factor TAP isoform X2 [Anopheles maculipalpis]
MPKRKKAPSPKFDLLEDGFDDDLSSNDDKPGTPIQRNAANARERARMRVLSKAFFNLKRNIPWVPADTKLSKLDTLRLAKNYITYLAATLDGQSVEDFSTNLAQPPKTAWPFIFQQVQPHETSSKTKHQQPTSTSTQSTVSFTATPPNVGQSTCSTDQQQKWLDYHQKDVTSGAGVLVSENIKSQTIVPPASNGLVGFSENFVAPSASSMDGGVNDYGTFGDPMGMVTRSATLHHTTQQQQQQHSIMQQDHHQPHHHHYQTSGGGLPLHNDGCHAGGAIGMSGTYHRQHMASIGSD